jgi:hypothetical protein
LTLQDTLAEELAPTLARAHFAPAAEEALTLQRALSRCLERARAPAEVRCYDEAGDLVVDGPGKDAAVEAVVAGADVPANAVGGDRRVLVDLRR